MKELFNYLKNNDAISKDDKTYTYDFFKKLDYVHQIYEMNPSLQKSYGNYNGRIAFVFQDHNQFELMKKKLSSFLEENNVSMWNIYLTVNKEDEFLMNELNAVAPKLICQFVSGPSETVTINDPKFNRILSTKYIKVNQDSIMEDSEEITNQLMIINFYKELEIKE